MPSTALPCSALLKQPAPASPHLHAQRPHEQVVRVVARQRDPVLLAEVRQREAYGAVEDGRNRLRSVELRLRPHVRVRDQVVRSVLEVDGGDGRPVEHLGGRRKLVIGAGDALWSSFPHQPTCSAKYCEREPSVCGQKHANVSPTRGFSGFCTPTVL